MATRAAGSMRVKLATPLGLGVTRRLLVPPVAHHDATKARFGRVVQAAIQATVDSL